MKKMILISCFVALVVCVLLCFFVSRWDIGDYISTIGSVASLCGIWIAYLQIKSVREIAEGTRAAVDNKLSDLNNHLTMADISRMLSIGREIQTFLLSSKLEVALIRMRDFKAELVQIRQNECIFTNEQLNRLGISIKDLGIDITNLSANFKKKDQISADAINDHIEDVLTLLAEIEGILKYKKYDTRELQGVN